MYRRTPCGANDRSFALNLPLASDVGILPPISKGTALSTLLIASSGPRAGRSLVAAAIAYRSARAGKQVTLVRLAGDEGAEADARAFAALEGVSSPGAPCNAGQLRGITGEVIAEAPPGPVALLAQPGTRVLVVASPSSPQLDVASAALAGTILTRVGPAEADAVSRRSGVLAVVREDRVLAAPSVADIAAHLKAKMLAEGEPGGGIERVMIGTVSSDAASPYFGQRERICVLTRFDKTDIQLAALQTDLGCLVLTGGGEPSPYLFDRVLGSRPDVAVMLADDSTVDCMRAIEPLYGASRFEGATKLARAVQLLDEAGVPVDTAASA